MTPGNLLQDLRFAVRTFSKSPGFVAVAVLSLTLGIGANTAIFTLTDQVLLRLLPVPHPEQLVLLSAIGRHYGSNMGSTHLLPHVQDIRDRNQVFSGMFARDMPLSFARRQHRTHLRRTRLRQLFPRPRRRPALGRVFTAADDLYQGGHPVAVLSYELLAVPLRGRPLRHRPQASCSTATPSPSSASARQATPESTPACPRKFASP